MTIKSHESEYVWIIKIAKTLKEKQEEAWGNKCWFQLGQGKKRKINVKSAFYTSFMICQAIQIIHISAFVTDDNARSTTQNQNIYFVKPDHCLPKHQEMSVQLEIKKNRGEGMSNVCLRSVRGGVLVWRLSPPGRSVCHPCLIHAIPVHIYRPPSPVYLFTGRHSSPTNTMQFKVHLSSVDRFDIKHSRYILHLNQ